MKVVVKKSIVNIMGYKLLHYLESALSQNYGGKFWGRNEFSGRIFLISLSRITNLAILGEAYLNMWSSKYDWKKSVYYFRAKW